MAAHGLNVPLSSQSLWFICSMGVGAIAALLYTILRSFTRQLPRKSIVVAAGDAFLGLMIAALEFAVILSMPQNRLRWFHLFGQGIGAVVFWVSAAPVVFKISSMLAKKLTKFIKRLQLLRERCRSMIQSLKSMKKTSVKANEKNS